MSTFDLAPSTMDELHDRIDAAHRRFAELAGEVGDDVTAGNWTCVETVAHLLTVMNRYTAFSPERLAADPRGVDEINERELSGYRQMPRAELLSLLDAEMDTLRAVWGPGSGIPLDMELPFHGGGVLDVQSALTNAMGEFLIHGHDLAVAAGMPWPIAERDAVLLCRFATRLLPAYVRRSNTDDADVRVEIDGLQPWTLQVRGATATVVPGIDTTPTVTLQGSAAAVALVFYSRTPVGGPGVTVTDHRPCPASPFSFAAHFEEP